MIILNDLTYKEYYNLEPDEQVEYDFAMKYGKRFNIPVDIFEVGDLTEQSFGFVKDLQFDMKEGLTWEKLFAMAIEILKAVSQNISSLCIILLFPLLRAIFQADGSGFTQNNPQIRREDWLLTR